MTLHVLSPGVLTTLQDCGRYGFSAIGVGVAGAMDPVASRLANILVANPARASTLEMTLRGPRLRVDADSLIAVTGADIDVQCAGHRVPTWRPVLLRAGSTITFGGVRHGARAYLAVAGGFAFEPILGSHSTDLNAAIGPIPRALVAGDRLPTLPAPRRLCSDLWGDLDRAPLKPCAFPAWSIDSSIWFDGAGERPIHALAGSHFCALDTDSQRTLFGATFRIGVDSNRVGYRIEGPTLSLREPLELISEGSTAGTLQLPPGGVPIALMVEAPPTGGYPRIAHVIAADLPRLAQRRPGDEVRFAQTDLDDAQMRYRERERAIARLEASVHLRLNKPY